MNWVWLQSFVIFSLPAVAVLSLSLHWFSCQFPSPGARPGCHAPFTAVRISAQKNRKIHKIIPYLTKTLSITQRFGVKSCDPRRNYTKSIFVCVWGWASWLNFPFSYQNVCLVLLSFVLRGWAWVPASARGRGSGQAGLQPMQQTFNQLKRSFNFENLNFIDQAQKHLLVYSTKVLKKLKIFFLFLFNFVWDRMSQARLCPRVGPGWGGGGGPTPGHTLRPN